MQDVYINAVSAFLPNDPIENDEIETVLGQSSQKPSKARRIVLRSNKIKQRYYAIDRESGKQSHSNAQLCAEAIKQLSSSERDVNAIALLSCGTSSPDQLAPNHTVMVHGELKNPPCEINAAAGICVSGVNALKYAYMSILCGEHTNAVATGSELVSAVMRAKNYEQEVASKIEQLEKNPEIAFEKDFLRWMLSDGAGAMWLSNTKHSDTTQLKIEWIAQKSYANEIEACMYAGAVKEEGELNSWMRYSQQEWLDLSIFSLKQDVKLLNENIPKYTLRYLSELMETKGIKAEDVDYFLPHYSSDFFRQKTYDGFKSIGFEIPYEKWFTNLGEKGNTGAASIYIIIEELLRTTTLKSGEKLFCFIPESGRFTFAFMLLSVV